MKDLYLYVVLHHWEYDGAEAVGLYDQKEDAERFAKYHTERGSSTEWWSVTELLVK